MGIKRSEPTTEDIANLRDYLKDIPPRRVKLLESFNEAGEISDSRVDRVTNMVLVLATILMNILAITII